MGLLVMYIKGVVGKDSPEIAGVKVSSSCFLHRKVIPVLPSLCTAMIDSVDASEREREREGNCKKERIDQVFTHCIHCTHCIQCIFTEAALTLIKW